VTKIRIAYSEKGFALYYPVIPLSLTNRYQFSSKLSSLKALSTVRSILYPLDLLASFSVQCKSYIHLVWHFYTKYMYINVYFYQILIAFHKLKIM
jgi:hypothetical protein